MTRSDKTELITGASAGLGTEFARLFAKGGHDVVLVARRRDKLETLATVLSKAHGINATVIAADLTDPKSPQRIADKLAVAGTDIDFLVNNAGFGTNGAFAELDGVRELDLLEVNIKALVGLTHLFLPGMIERGYGKVLNIGSTAGFQPGPFMADYYASKAFVISFTEAIAQELRGTGVTATVACPGATTTEFADTAGVDESMLFKMRVADAPSVAEDAYRAMMSGKAKTIPGIFNRVTAEFSRIGPTSLTSRLSARLNKS